MKAARKLAGVFVAIGVMGVLIGFYITGWLMSGPSTYHPPVSAGSSDQKQVNLTIQTVAAVGPTLAPNPDWVSYLVRDAQGRWLRTTIWAVPAHSLVHVTVYQFDGDSGLRNAFMAKVRGTVGNTMTVNGKTDERDQPGRRISHVRDPTTGADRAALGRAGRREEPVRLRARAR